MQYIEVLLIAAGTLLLILAFLLGKRGQSGTDSPADGRMPSAVSAENAVKLQNSLTELLAELQALSRDVTADLEERLSELKELIQLADSKSGELSAAELQSPETSSEGDDEVPTEPLSPELQLTVEDDDDPPLSPGRYRQIYQMADDGLSLDEIARRVRMGKGEIQLILSLRQRD